MYLSRGEEMTQNPLSKYFRKPEIYIKLPTSGRFNPEFSQTILDEVGVMPMTAIDEITIKNPDALLNGEALLSVIKSCVPDIPDPNNMCNIDVEALYLAIQYATYGEELTHTHECKSCKEKSDFNIDINYVLNRFPDIDKIEPIQFDELTIHIRPPTVKSMSKLALIELEQKKIVQSFTVALEEDVKETEMARRFYAGFKKIAEYNVDMLASAIQKIETPDGVVDDYDTICEFLDNVPTKLVDKVNEKIKVVSHKPDDASKFEFTCPECEHKDEVVLEVNPVNFFVNG